MNICHNYISTHVQLYAKRPYWKHNLGIKMAKCTYNAQLKTFRRRNTPETLKQVQEAYKAYTELCTLVRNNSWNAWITECNNNPNTAEVWRRIKAANGRPQLAATHPRPKEEANILCDTFIQRSSSVNLPKDTTETLTELFPDRVNIIKTVINKEAETDRNFTLSELDEVISHLKDTAPGIDTVCYSMIKNMPLPTKYLILRLINQSFTEGRLPKAWKVAKIVPIPKKDMTYRPISLLPALSKVMERMVLARINWYAQPLHQNSLGFKRGFGTIDAVATLLQKVTPIRTLRPGYKSRTTTIFLDLEKAFELVSKEVILESTLRQGIKGKIIAWLDNYLTHRSGIVQFQGESSATQTFNNGTPQGSSLSPTLFNMVINQLLQLNLGKGTQMIAYADDIAISISNMGEHKVYQKMTTALERIELEAVRLGLKFSPSKCEAIWYRSKNPEWHFKIAGKDIPWCSSVKYLGVIIDKGLKFRKQVDYIRQTTDRKMNALKVISACSGVNAAVLKNIYTATVQSTLEYGAVTFGLMSENSMDKLQVIQNQGMRCILGAPRSTSAVMMRQELQFLPVIHRAQLHRTKLFMKIQMNTNHPLHKIINTTHRGHRIDWTTEIQKCHRLLSDPRDNNNPPIQTKESAPWEVLPYECRIDWTPDGIESVKQKALTYINLHPADNTYYTDGSSDGNRVAAAFIHQTEETIIRLNDSASVLDAEMMAILMALLNAARHRKKSIIHTDSLTAVQTLKNRRIETNPITKAIRKVAKRMTHTPTINWIPSHTGIFGNERADQAAKSGLELQTVDRKVPVSSSRRRRKAIEIIRTKYNEDIYTHASQRTINHRKLVQTVKSRKALMNMQRKTQRSIWRLRLRSLTYSQMTTNQPLTCRWCGDEYNCITDHWILHCPAMEYWRTLMRSQLPSGHYLSDTDKTIAVLNSQDAHSYEEMKGLLREFPLPAPRS